MDTATLKIAVVTDDGTTIHRHFGRAQHYMIYTVEDGKITSKQQVDKPSHHNHGHHHHDHDHDHHDDHDTIQVGEIEDKGHDHHHDADRHRDMFQPLQGCNVLITGGMGRGAFNGLNAIQVEPIITTMRNIEEAIQSYLDGNLENHLEKLH